MSIADAFIAALPTEAELRAQRYNNEADALSRQLDAAHRDIATLQQYVKQLQMDLLAAKADAEGCYAMAKGLRTEATACPHRHAHHTLLQASNIPSKNGNPAQRMHDLYREVHDSFLREHGVHDPEKYRST